MSNPKSTILRCENLGRTVHDKRLIEAVSFEVREGGVLAVVGPSGSGKSTLLRLLNRLDEPTTGTVYLDGIDYRQIDPRDLRRRVGMVTQRPFLFPGTIEQNLRFGPAQQDRDLTPEAVARLLSDVGLHGYAGRTISNLSGGEAQRVSLARTLANSPVVILLDEPTSALDEASKSGVESLLRDIVRDQRLACILVTHDMAQGARLADRALILEAGKVVRIEATSGWSHA